MGAKSWGSSKCSQLETLHMKFCKRLLSVPKSCNNSVCYGELGRYPMWVRCQLAILAYWQKLLSTVHQLLRSLFMSLRDSADLGKTNWFSNVRYILNRLGASNLWLANASDRKYVLKLLEIRTNDLFLQEWRSTLVNSRKLQLYKNLVSPVFLFTDLNYLDCSNYKSFKQLTRYRTSTHSLMIETGRHQGVPRENRFCKFCYDVIEDEFHFFLQCPKYDVPRQRFIKPFYAAHLNMYKMSCLLICSNKSVTSNLVKYVREAERIRVA